MSSIKFNVKENKIRSAYSDNSAQIFCDIDSELLKEKDKTIIRKMTLQEYQKLIEDIYFK
ncbi:MAG: hypothetical protein HOL12_03340 [Kordiimonadaceae bacterium]|jgi:hypothetical protein|nr:hypothetical protein [Kordiimonadaceae bacterium]